MVAYGWARGQHAALKPGLPAEKKRGREEALFLVLESETHTPRVSLLLDSWLTSALYWTILIFEEERTRCRESDLTSLL